MDSGSTDATLEICRELGARVHVTADWPGPGAAEEPRHRRGERRLGARSRRGRMGHRRVAARDRGGHACAGRRGRVRHPAPVELLRPLHAPRRLVARLHRAAFPARQGALRGRDRARPPGRRKARRGSCAATSCTNPSPTWTRCCRRSTATRPGARRLWPGKAGVAGSPPRSATACGRSSGPTCCATGFWTGARDFMLAVSNAEGAYYRYVKLMLLQEKRDE